MTNEKQVKRTLDVLLPILQDLEIEHRFFGSVVISAINGELHRELGDLDLLIDQSKQEQLDKALLDLGYRQGEGMRFLTSFSRRYLHAEELVHPQLMSIGYFYGKWQDSGAFEIGDKVKITVESQALKPTGYSLYSYEFIGVPPEVVATGVMTSAENPKRKRELEILESHSIQPMSNDYLHVSVLDLPADFTYHWTMAFLNLLGRIRVKLGKSFDPWR